MTAKETATKIINMFSLGAGPQRENLISLATEMVQQAIDERGMAGDYTVMGYAIKCVCDRDPEQYHVYKNDVECGFIHVRGRKLVVKAPDAGGLLVYESPTVGIDAMDSEERHTFLRIAVATIHAYIVTMKDVTIPLQEGHE